MTTRLFSASIAAAGVAGAIVALAAASIPSAQQSNSVSLAQGPSFRSKIDLVRLDVSIIDKDRRPVRGLTAADFSVFEDGKPQKIVNFSAVDAVDPPPVPVVNGTPVTWVRDVSSDVQDNTTAVDTPESRLFVLVIDDALIPSDSEMIKKTRVAARAVIERLGQADRAAFVLTSDIEGAHDFTADKGRLLAGLDRLKPGRANYTFGWDTIESKFDHDCHPTAPVTRSNDGDIPLRDVSFNTLRSVVEALIASPERRKAVIYIGPGIPINPGDAGVVPIGAVSDARVGNAGPILLHEEIYCPHPATQPPREGAVIHEANDRLSSSLKDLFQRMRLANVVMYPIDPSGVAGLAPYISRAYETVPQLSGYQKVPIDAAGRPPVAGAAVPLPSSLGAFQANLSLDFLKTSAANTGGRAIVNTDDVEAGVQRIFDENRSFYLLGYQPPAGSHPGSEHWLTVKLNRSDVTVNVRSGYVTAKPASANPKPAVPAALSKAIADLLPAGDVPLRVALTPMKLVRPDAKTKMRDIPGDMARVAIVLGFAQSLALKPVATVDGVRIQVSAFTEGGAARISAAQEATVTMRPWPAGTLARYEVLSHIDLRPGRYQLRIAVHSTLTDAIGSVFADVVIPDFGMEPLSLSGVFVEAQPRVLAAPHDAFSALLPIVPTSERTFRPLDRVSALLRIYEGGTKALGGVTLATTIVNERGETVLKQTDDFPSSTFGVASRTAEHRLQVPVRLLPRGEYLLTYTATAGRSVRTRQVRFTID